MEDYKKEGIAFKQLLLSKGYSVRTFARESYYSQSRLYRLCAGTNDLRTVSVYNIVIWCKLLKLNSIEEFYYLCEIDLLNEI